MGGSSEVEDGKKGEGLGKRKGVTTLVTTRQV